MQPIVEFLTTPAGLGIAPARVGGMLAAQVKLIS